MNDHDDAFVSRSQTTWRAGDDDLDPVTTARLSAARRRAVERAGAPRRAWRQWWLPATAFASVAAGVTVVALGLGVLGRAPDAVPAVPVVEGYELLAAEEDLALFEDDLEFYDWAVAVADAG